MRGRYRTRRESEERSTGEARFVNDLDHLDACLQATVYREEGSDSPMDEFFETAKAELTTERGRQRFAAIGESKIQMTGSVRR